MAPFQIISDTCFLLVTGCVLVVNKQKRVEQLKLALAWNRIDVAKEEIFSDGAVWKVCSLVNFMLSHCGFIEHTWHNMNFESEAWAVDGWKRND